MRIIYFKYWACLFILIGCLSTPFAQELPLQVLRESEGLTSNFTWFGSTLHSDNHGIVWFGNQGGLNRFDGYDIVPFNGSKSGAFDVPNNKISAIAEDGFGHIWLGSEEEGLIRYDPLTECFQSWSTGPRNIDSIELSQINAIRTDSDGNLLISAAHEGLFKYLIAEDTMIQVFFSKEKNGSRYVNTAYALGNGKMLIIAFWGVYYGSLEEGFIKFDIPYKYYLRSALALPDGKIRLYSPRFGKYFVLDPLMATIDTLSTHNELLVCGAFLDRDNNIWTSYDEGSLTLEPFNSDSIISYSMQTDINGKQVDICMLSMNDEVDGEVFYSSQSTGAGSFQTINSGFSYLVKGKIGSIQQYHDTMFFADGNKIKFFGGNGTEVLPLKSPSPNDIWGFIIDRKGHFWVHYTDDNEYQFNEFNRQGNLLSQGTPGRLFPQIAQLSDGNLVIGCAKYDDFDRNYQVKFIGEYYENISGKKYPKFRTKHFRELQNGDIWISTFASGILRITDSHSSYDYIPIDHVGNGKLNSNNPYYVFEAKNNEILVCTDKGINILYPDHPNFVYFQSGDLNLQNIKGMVQDENGMVWILTSE